MSQADYDIAHLRHQGQDIIIVPVEDVFENYTQDEQMELRDSLQFYAQDADLRGTVCIVWQRGNRLRFLAPKPWWPFFESIDMHFVRANINRRLTCRSG
ncbi:MAG: hypothetical protein RJQ08_02235 [Salinisphaeraceae bacterium]